MTIHSEPATVNPDDSVLAETTQAGAEVSQAAADLMDGIRQRAVERLMIIDTPPEERFDRLTRLAQKVFSVPIAMISLIDGDRVWQKSCAGISISQSPRSESFCDKTVTLGRVLVVEDAQQDPRFAGLPTVTGHPGIRFYAGYPLHDSNRVVVGAFCLVDLTPRTLDDHKSELLAELATWAQQELTDSADSRRARYVQQKLLPKSPPALPGYDVAALCVPAQIVGGDFYDYARFGNGFGFCVADVMGKGMGAAIITATVRAAVRGAPHRLSRNRDARSIYSAAAVLTRASQAIQRDLEQTDALVTSFVAYIDGPSGTVSYADAGHGLTTVVSPDGRVRWLESDDLPLGVDARSGWSEHQTTLEPGETLLCFSDGLLDLLGGTRESLDKVAQLVRRHPDPKELTQRLRELTAAGEADDDVTALAVRRSSRS